MCNWVDVASGRTRLLGLTVLALFLWAMSVRLAVGETYIVDQRQAAKAEGATGAPDAPFARISQAAQVAKAGDTVLIRAGVYRESVKIEASGQPGNPIVFAADTGANVSITGADLLTSWRKEPDEVWSVDWPHRFIGWNAQGIHPDDSWHQMIGRCEQVFVSGYALQQVLKREAVVRGTFFVDLPGKRLYACGRGGEDLSQPDAHVEASVRPVLWEVTGAFVHVKGLRFRYAANMAQHGMALFAGAHGVIEDCVFERANSSGAAFTAEDLTVRRCTFQDNGQLGFGGAGAHRLHFSECLVRNNNTKQFSRGWEAGGDKLVLSRNVVIDHCRFLENRGTGIWFDIGNEDCEVSNCLIANNEEAGLFYEISYGLHLHDCVFIGNGFEGGGGAWGCRSGATLSSSQNCVVERNLFIGNAEGFDFREQDRTTPRIGPASGSRDERIWNQNHRIQNNLFVANRDAQVGGWFDDERHWPKPKSPAVAQTTLEQPEDSANHPGAPGLYLESFQLRFSGNCYSILAGQPLWQWGAMWKKHRLYPDLSSLNQDLDIEPSGQMIEPQFADWAAKDLRLPKNHPAILHGAYPKGEVPGCVLGIVPDGR